MADIGAAFVGIVMIVSATRARARLVKYRRWREAWESMGNESSQPSPKFWRRVAGVCLIGLVTLYSYVSRDEPASKFALIWLMTGLALTVVVVLIQRAYKRRASLRASKNTDFVVVQSIRAPLMAVPPLEVAYRRLPAHCNQLLTTEHD
jgi:hypothetical protein